VRVGKGPKKNILYHAENRCVRSDPERQSKHGVMSFTVSQRTQEIGLRMALGAQLTNVRGMILGQTLKLTLIGVGLGLAGAFVLARFLASLLFGVGTYDPVTFLGVALLLIGVALAASYIPARRAMRVDPIVALRYE